MFSWRRGWWPAVVLMSLFRPVPSHSDESNKWLRSPVIFLSLSGSWDSKQEPLPIICTLCWSYNLYPLGPHLRGIESSPWASSYKFMQQPQIYAIWYNAISEVERVLTLQMSLVGHGKKLRLNILFKGKQSFMIPSMRSLRYVAWGFFDLQTCLVLIDSLGILHSLRQWKQCVIIDVTELFFTKKPPTLCRVLLVAMQYCTSIVHTTVTIVKINSCDDDIHTGYLA